MAIPSVIPAGVDVSWTDAETTDNFGNALTSADYNLRYYFRHSTAGQGANILAVADGSGWRTELTSLQTTNWTPGNDWYFQAVLSKIGADDMYEYSRGQIKVNESLVYIGSNPDAFDGRSQARKDLDAVEAAIRSIATGGLVSEYRIGNRNLKRYSMAELIQLKHELKSIVNREDRAKLMASGLGDPHNLYVRFNRG